MKIEVIEKKREEAMDTPFIVGGVYREIVGSSASYFQLVKYGFGGNEYALVVVDEGILLHNLRGNALRTQECINRMTYVPNARLVIDDND